MLALILTLRCLGDSGAVSLMPQLAERFSGHALVSISERSGNLPALLVTSEIILICSYEIVRLPSDCQYELFLHDPIAHS